MRMVPGRGQGLALLVAADFYAMFKKSQSVPLSEAGLLPGDHIYVKRTTRHYKHHGIYIGQGKVIHVSGSIREKRDPEVCETDLSIFLNGGILRRRGAE